MSGFDVLFDQDVSLTSLQEAIATVMDIELGRVAIIGDIEQYPRACYALFDDLPM